MITNINVEKISRRLINKYVNVTQRANAETFANNLSYRVFKQDNFTVVTLLSDKELISVGVAKRMPNDHENDVIGTNIAYVRALKNALIAFNDVGNTEKARENEIFSKIDVE